MPRGCRAFNSDLRIRIPSAGVYTYADCSVICGELQYSGTQREAILNPLLIVEVLSPSSEDYDDGKKFEIYREIATFREYLLIHQDRYNVEHYSKQENGTWVLSEHKGVEAVIALPRLRLTLSLAELYDSAPDPA